MKKILFALVFISSISYAQQLDEARFYAKMAVEDAEALQYDFPDEVTILAKQNGEAAVFMTQKASHELHERVLVHGPGYMFKNTEAEAIASINQPTAAIKSIIDFSITEDAIVNEAIALVDPSNIAVHIMELEDYGTRHHTTSSGLQSAIDLKDKWETMAADYGRDDVSVRLFNHVNTNMPSVILTIEGATLPNEFVIVGGHLDSTSSQSQTNAPGADDDASGIATITESIRVLFEMDYTPQRTIEVMAYAAEEIGLVGSAEIANQYANNNIDVGAVVQFDMTNFKGSSNDISFITDFTNATLNNYLISLLDHYNSSGDHQVTYGTSLCNYGCSDHASWTEAGFMASFPFEANFGDHNNNIHTPNDTFSVSGTAFHAAKFAKLCTEFLIEASKSAVLGVDEVLQNSVTITTTNGALLYDLAQNNAGFEKVILYNALGSKIKQKDITNISGSIATTNLSQGFYLLSFVSQNKKVVTKKVVIK